MTSLLTKIAPGAHGVALLDKPSGITSHDLVDRVRRVTGVRRVGHAGTLDPLATGLMIILIGREFTKLQSNFLKQDKEYLVTADFGYSTDSYDASGELIAQAASDQLALINSELVARALQKFRGQISQTVPAFSAVKIGGKKLYQMARSASELGPAVLPSREVRVDIFEQIDLNSLDESFVKLSPPLSLKIEPISFAFRVRCSSGTYVRSLIHDLGQEMGVGATVTGLKRTKIGDFRVEDSIPI